MMFSFVIPVYNVAPYLRDCLDSVLAQTDADWEATCVDDGSTDGSASILDEYAARDSRIRVIHQQNAGVCVARNAGLQVATGQWIVFVDSDDVIHPQTLALYRRAVESDPDADMIRCKDRIIPEKGNPDFLPPADVKMMSKDISKVVDAQSFYGYFLLGAFRSDIHKAHKFGAPVKLKIGEDNLFYTQALELSRRIVFVDAEIYCYRQRSGSAFHSCRDVDFWRNDFAHYYQVLKIFNESRKTFARNVVREYSMRTTEGYSDLLPKGDSPESVAKWNILLEFYGKVCGFSVLPRWFRFVTKMCYVTKSKAVYALLCRAPRKMKRMGLHG